MTPNLVERVAIMETEIRNMGDHLFAIQGLQNHQDATLNSICVNVATINSQLISTFEKLDILTEAKNIWQNPLVWTNLLSLGVAVFALIKK